MPEYVEREKLLEEIHTARNQLVLGKTAAAKLEKMVRAVPAADVGSHLPVRSVLDDSHRESAPPVVHGRWIQVDDTKCKCSECEVVTLIAQYPYGDKNYCPNCGAKMDLEAAP